MKELFPIAVTMGEPAGIGGEILVRMWQSARSDLPPFFGIDRPERIRRVCREISVDIDIAEIADPAEAPSVFDRQLPILPIDTPIEFEFGKPSPETASAVIGSIDRAVALARSGEVRGVVTNPIQKETLYDAGFAFPGHTEYLAQISESAVDSVMMLASPSLRVVPVTVHVSLQEAVDSLTTDIIVEATLTAAAALRTDFGIAAPRIAVAGLNPHAGESGALGTEEITIIQPAIERLRTAGIQVFGPVPPDALFTPRARTGYDAAICMYHDQALIPIKALDFDHAVNVTLGLPIVRTSPDHGTALDIAGKGLADPTSLSAAVRMADSISAHRMAAGGD